MANIITEKVYEFILSESKKKERIDVYLSNSIENATRSRIQQLIKAGYVTVNGKAEKSNYIVKGGDRILVKIPCSPRPDCVEPEYMPLNIVYEDEYLMVINKPAGIVVHPSLGNFTGTLVHGLLYHTMNLSLLNEKSRPGIVHRIDKDTSGLLVIAKDEWTHAQLASQFSKHSIEREYWALCWGCPKERKGEIIGNIARSKKDRKIFTVSPDEGKHAHTFFEVLEEFEFLSLIKLNLKTGRTHQIRVHLSHIKHPIFGDKVYNGRSIHYGNSLPKISQRVDNLLEIMQRQALHAKTIGFYHPHKKEIVRFDSPLPDDMVEVIKKIRN